MSFAPLQLPNRNPRSGAVSQPQAPPQAPPPVLPGWTRTGLAIQRFPEAGGTEKGVAGLIVSDDAEPAAGKMRKSDFLAQLREAVCAAAADALAGAIWTAESCPAIEQWFDYYDTQSAGHVEEAIRRYAPEAENVESAAGYMPLVTGRVRQSIRKWAAGGSMPEDLPAVVPYARGEDDGVTKAQLLAGPGGGDTAVNAAGVAAQLGSGSALDGAARLKMESAFHADFSGVRVHADRQGAKLSDHLDARAFTVSNHVAFGAGEYGPGTLVGDALLAHELAHVVQQRGGGPAQSDTQTLEHHADQAAEQAVLAGSGASFTMAHVRAGLRIQRCGKSKDDPTPAPKPADAGVRDAAAGPDREKISARIEALLLDPDGNAGEILKIIDGLGDNATSVLEITAPFDGGQSLDLGVLMGSRKAREMLKRVSAELAKGDANAKKTAERIDAAIEAHEAAPKVKPKKAEADAIAQINAALNDKDPKSAEYGSFAPPLKFPVQLYRAGTEETGGVYYDPDLPGTEKGAAGLTSAPRLKINEMPGRPLIFIRLGPLAIRSPDASRHSNADTQQTLYHEFQHYRRYVELRKPEKQSPEAKIIEGETGLAEAPNAEVEATSTALAAYFDRMKDDEVTSALLYLARFLGGDIDAKLFRDPAVSRIRKAVSGKPASQSRLIRLIGNLQPGDQAALAPLRAAIEADQAKSK